VPYILKGPPQIKAKFNLKYMPAIPQGKCDTFGVGYVRGPESEPEPEPEPLPAV